MVDISEDRFEELVVDALDSIPDELAQLIDNVAVVIQERGRDPHLLGLYEGIPLTERGDYGIGGPLPDRIAIYRAPLLAMCDSEEEIVHQVRVTVVHEVGHHFGIDDDRLDQLGWA